MTEVMDTSNEGLRDNLSLRWLLAKVIRRGISVGL